jgi:hypothetical protein
MKKTLLTSSAIAGSMMLLSVSSALSQTTVSGNLNLSYKAIANKGSAANKVNSTEFFGKEIQINLANKGTLNNGLAYAAGFSIEQDGSQLSSSASTTSASTDGIGVFSENVYIDLISGSTTFSIGADHVQNPDHEIANLVGIADIDDNASGIMNRAPSYVANSNSAYQAFGVAVIQNTPVGNFSIGYRPDATNALAGPDDGGVGTAVNSYSKAEGQYEVGYRGSPVKGLNLSAFYNSASTGITTSNSDKTGYMVGASYNMGRFTAAVSEKETNSLGTSNEDVSIASRQYALAYALTNNLTVGVNYATTDKTATTVDEKLKQVSVGYNLGPIYTGVSYVKATGMGNNADNEGDAAFVFMGTRF